MKGQDLPDWREFVGVDATVLAGKPVVRGTRLSVDFLLGLLAKGWSQAEVLENYPALNENSLRAVLAYAAQKLSEERVQVLDVA